MTHYLDFHLPSMRKEIIMDKSVCDYVYIFENYTTSELKKEHRQAWASKNAKDEYEKQKALDILEAVRIVLHQREREEVC